MKSKQLAGETVLITGAARRLGAAIAECLYDAGMNVALHCRRSTASAQALRDRLRRTGAGSVSVHVGDLLDPATLANLVPEVIDAHGSLHSLVNNASSFYPTRLGETTESEWSDLVGTNLKAPFFLAQAARPYLEGRRGCIVNLTDIYADRPLPGHTVYNVAKAGLRMLTESLALELAPGVRVNAIAPGPILWPEGGGAHGVDEVLRGTPLGRKGEAREIAAAALFLIRDAGYTTGTTLHVDGGRRIAGY